MFAPACDAAKTDVVPKSRAEIVMRDLMVVIVMLSELTMVM